MVVESDVRLRRRLAELIGRYEVPGVSVSVLVDGEVTDAAAGVVNVATDVEVQPNSPFMIQSITKVWTATLVMQLVDEGSVALDEPISRYLPGFHTADPRSSAAITVRHLLTHTGGFEGDIWTPTTCGDDALQLFVDEQVANASQHLPPGAQYSYCSAGMGVLGRLVEVFRETTYAEALRRHLTDPLGLDGVAFNANEALAFRTAIGHVRPREEGPLRPLRNWAVLPPSNPAAGNQLAMPARGLIEFARMHLAEGLAPDGNRLLSDDSAGAMREPQVDVPATVGGSVRQGLGWRLTSVSRVVEHGGGAPGCGAMLQLVPDHQVAVAVLVNGGDMNGLVTQLCEELLGELAGVAPTPGPAPAPPATAVVDADRFCGRYELRNQVAEVTLDPAGFLWLTQEERNEAATVAARAGVETNAAHAELRQMDDAAFLRVDAQGHAVGVIEFIGTDDSGRARYIHDGQAAPRVA